MKLDNLIDTIKALPAIDFAKLKNLFLSGEFDSIGSIEDFLIEKRFENGEFCPVCNDTHIVRNGHRKDGTQKFLCRNCGKAFGITTNSITAGTKKDLAVWSKYISCMQDGLTIEASAENAGSTKILHSPGVIRSWMLFKTWPEELLYPVWSKQTRHLQPYPIKEITREVTTLRCPADHTKEDMGHINNYHSQLKRFINHRFNGVSTKYLNNYIVWHNFINWAKGTSKEKNKIFTTFVLSTLKKVRNCDLSSRAAIPFFRNEWLSVNF